jgi:hypothetical protein
MFVNALWKQREATSKEEAVFNDFMRRFLQTDGQLPEAGRFNGIKVDASRYNSQNQIFKRVINSYLITNLADAQMVAKLATMFPGEIDKKFCMVITLKNFLQKATDGLYFENGEFYFEKDPSKDLAIIALGAQCLFDEYSKQNSSALMKLDNQAVSAENRRAMNVGLFSGEAMQRAIWIERMRKLRGIMP